MNIVEYAIRIFECADTLGVPYMAVGAIAAGTYGIPRATKDVDLLVSIDAQNGVNQLISGLEDFIEFDQQPQFDTITWGRRHIGCSKVPPPLKIELFEMFDDPFVHSEFARRSLTYVPILGSEIWLPTAEDVIVQKIRWGRSKDLDDARDVLAVQDPATLDMTYVRQWCDTHGTATRLDEILASLPPI